MSVKNISNGILRAVFILAGIVLFGWFIFKIRVVIAYVAIAAVVALIGRPIIKFLNSRLKAPNLVAVVTTMLLFLMILVGLILLFVPLIAEQGRNLSLLDIDAFKADLNALYLEALHFFGAEEKELQQILMRKDVDVSLLQGLDFNFIPNLFNAMVGMLSSVSMGLFSVLFISFFFMKDSLLLQNGLLTFMPKTKENSLVTSIGKINGLLSRYFVGILGQLTILFVIYVITLIAVGVPNAFVIAFLCALFNIIPYVGPIIGAVIMVVLTMTSFLGHDFSSVILPKATWVMVGIIIGQLIDNFFSQPVIFSKSVKSHPLEIFLVILITGILFGITGMVVAVPGYTAVKVILKEFLQGNVIIDKFTKNV